MTNGHTLRCVECWGIVCGPAPHGRRQDGWTSTATAKWSSGSQSPILGDMWRYGCPKSPDWDGDVESWTESEGTSSSEQCEHSVESLALNATEQDQ